MDKNLLRNLVPINALNERNLGLLAEQASIEDLPAGTKLFEQGNVDNHTVYLLSGEVALSTNDTHRTRRVVGGTASARTALARLTPRQFTGLAMTPVTILRIDSELIDRLLSWDQVTSSVYEVTEFESSEDMDWMAHLLRSKTFERLPASNADALFRRFQPLHVKAGQIIIRQGDPGDYYYLIKSGKADVVCNMEKKHKVSVIDQIHEGEGFGESALLTGSPRNATVVMVTDGVLMRLGKKDFDELLREPLVNWLEVAEARALVKDGAALVDVRLEEEFHHGTIRGSINIPLYQLRKKSADLDPNRHYIVFCHTGSRASAAAFLLTQRGFQVSALRGGLDALRQQAALT